MEKIAAMREGGAKLRQIKTQLQDYAQVGKSFLEVDALATKLIVASGGKPNFSLVPGYHHTTCINRNQGIVHGIPNQTIIESGDLISIDFGMLYQGWNLDTSISFVAGQSNPSLDNFLSVGKKALAKAIAVAIAGNSIYDISFKIEKTITRAGFSPTYQLTGHSIGKKLHENPLIPNIADKADRRHVLKVGDTLAIEVMYAMGECDLVLGNDGWTYETADGSLTALFEDTVAITNNGPEIMT